VESLPKPLQRRGLRRLQNFEVVAEKIEMIVVLMIKE
jgi:hypothetical protein